MQSDDPDVPSELSKFVEAAQKDDPPHFRDVKLCRMDRNIIRQFDDSRTKYIEAISKCIHNRFNDLEKDFFKAIHLLDTKLWPTGKDDLGMFGVAEISIAVDHFKALLKKKNVSFDGVMAERTSFKFYWLDNMQAYEQGVVWSLLLSHYQEKFPNLAPLMNILLVIPVSNAKVERGFSAMHRIKSEWWSSLGEETLDALMRISINGPPLAQFDPKPAVQKFFSNPRRPNV